jgi:5-methylcytosine-specific restriction endonuclease McrA
LLDGLTAGDFDHIVPLALGGLNDVTNLQLLCKGCNGTKGGRRRAASNHYRRWYKL